MWRAVLEVGPLTYYGEGTSKAEANMYAARKAMAYLDKHYWDPYDLSYIYGRPKRSPSALLSTAEREAAAIGQATDMPAPCEDARGLVPS